MKFSQAKTLSIPDELEISGSEASASVSSQEVLLRLSGLRKTYGSFVAVDRIDLDVRKGELMTFLGPSGSGKTSVLNMIAGFDDPTAGEIFIGGRPMAGVSPHRRNIGMVFQRYTLFPHLTVYENVEFPLKVRRFDRAERPDRVEKVLNLVRLQGLGHRKPSELSGGQQQRVALARGLVYEPMILLMDEPLGALDKKLREDIQDEIRRLHERLGVTIIYVTHDQEEALRLSDRITVMNAGTVEQTGAPRELYDAPANSFMASFVGNSNFLPGRLLKRDGDSALVALEGGGMVRAVAREGLEAGSEVSLMVRPERFTLCSPGKPGDYENRILTSVKECVFLGDCITCSVALPGGQTAAVKLTHGPGDLPSLTTGASVELCWRSQHSLVFPVEPAASSTGLPSGVSR